MARHFDFVLNSKSVEGAITWVSARPDGEGAQEKPDTQARGANALL